MCHSDFEYNLHGPTLATVTSAKHLGTTISKEASWISFADAVQAKANRRLGFLGYSFNISCRKLREKTYVIFVSPILKYTSSVYYVCMGPSTPRCTLTRLTPYNPHLSNVSPPKPEVGQIRVQRIPSPARTSVVLVHASSLTHSSPCFESEFSFLLLLNSGMAGVLS